MLGPTAVSALLLGTGIWLSVVVLRLDPPSFSVDRLSSHNASAQHHLEVDYDFSLTAVNPNKVTTLWYRNGSTARLLHQGMTLAKATKVGRPKDSGKDAKDFNLLLRGGGHAPPKAVEKALRESKEGALALELTVEVPVHVHMGVVEIATKRLVVACEMRTTGLGKHVHIFL
uniref:Late embryogenesis abundant protein LEA-2 subgroup domain-containing protein n=1 Tax=Hordeum vulgare subsp. vulgare TaxID=112509 RepID=A0A8I6YKD4_HORVV